MDKAAWEYAKRLENTVDRLKQKLQTARLDGMREFEKYVEEQLILLGNQQNISTFMAVIRVMKECLKEKEDGKV